MTIYTDREESAHDSSPVEGYKFIGTFRNYFYTSIEQDVTINGEVYSAIAIERTAVEAGTQDDDSAELVLEMPFDIELAQDYAFTKAPPNLTLEIYRYHEGTDPASDWVLIWKGPVAGFSVSDKIAKCRVPSIFSSALSREMPNVYYQNPCNHVLFNSRCKVVSGSFKQSTTITAVGDQEITVAADGFSDSFLKGGEAVNITTGERRLIADNISDVLSITFDFFNASIGDVVELFAGCDHSFATCGTKFSNKVNYGGHPYISKDNPFDSEL